MRMSGIAVAVLSLLSALPAAAADDRFGCMAEDRRLKMAVKMEFSGDLGGRLVHLAGRLGIDDPAAPEGLAARRLTSQMRSQSWGEQGLVMVRLFDDETDRRILDVTLVAAAASPGETRMSGHYTIRSIPSKGTPYVVSGALFCQQEPERTALLKMYPSEAE